MNDKMLLAAATLLIRLDDLVKPWVVISERLALVCHRLIDGISDEDGKLDKLAVILRDQEEATELAGMRNLAERILRLLQSGNPGLAEKLCRAALKE